ncbi:MFS transporter [Bounagaea algeriensis]
MPVALLALAIAAFGIGTTEFVMMGLLPEVATAMNVSEPVAGSYISLYALGVVIGAPLLTIAGMRAHRKTVLLNMLVLFTIGNLGSAFAANHGMLLVTRFISGLPHGTFFGIGAVVAASLVAHHKRTQAISMMFIGLTVANIVGVPVGTLLGQQLGWRWTFGLVAAIGLVALIAVAALVPQQSKPQNVSVSGELRTFLRGRMWLAFGVVVFGFAATFSFYSYIKPVLTDITGFTPIAVTVLLAVFGVGMTVGTALGGRLGDIAPMWTLCVGLSALAVSLALFTVTAQNMVLATINVFLIGATAFTAMPSIQGRILDLAKDAPALGSASIQSTFNIANSLGASAGGAVLGAGFGLLSPSWIGAVLALAGLGFAVASAWSDRRSQPTPEVVASHRTDGEPATAGGSAQLADTRGGTHN